MLRINPRDPLDDAAAQVLDVREAFVLHEVHGLRAADAGLALDDDVLAGSGRTNFVEALGQLA